MTFFTRLFWHDFFGTTFLAKIKGINPGNDCGNKMVDSALGGRSQTPKSLFLAQWFTKE